MERLIICGIIPLFILGFAGCSDEESNGPTEPVPEIAKGLSGDTYMNTKFGIKISNLPVDEWTVKALGNEGQGLQTQTEQGLIPLYNLLLMEPVPPDQFVGLSKKADLGPVLESDIPFIWVGLDYQKGGSYGTFDLTENLSSYAELHSAEIESKKFVNIGNATGIQAVLLRTFGKEALTWFAKGEIMVRCEYIVNESEFDTYLDVYEQVVENIWLMGK